MESCLAEVHALQEQKSCNRDKEWKARDDQLIRLKLITERFMKYLNKFSLDPSDNPNAIQNVSNNRYLPNRSLVLSGSEIFNFFFDGTSGDFVDDQGIVSKRSLRTDWAFI